MRISHATNEQQSLILYKNCREYNCIQFFLCKSGHQLLQRKRNILPFTVYSYLGMFQEVGEFVVDNSGKHKLFLNSESIVWPYNLTAPSSGIPKCEACDEHCYNGEAMINFFAVNLNLPWIMLLRTLSSHANGDCMPHCMPLCMQRK